MHLGQDRVPAVGTAGQDGSVSIVALMAAVALLATAALSIDVGTFFLAKRKQQTATDIAAVVAASDLAKASEAVQAQLAANGFNPGALTSLELGSYRADPKLPAAQRFQATSSTVADAIRVTVTSTAPMYFGSALIPSASAAGASGNAAPGVTISTQATAAQADFMSFAVGSQLADLDSSLLNQVLGGLLGAHFSLSAMDYQALAAAQVDLWTFSNLLATRIGLQGVSYGQLATATVHYGDALLAMSEAIRVAGGGAAASAALVQIATSNIPGANALRLGSLIDFGPFALMAVGADAPVSVVLSALDALRMFAECAGQNQQIVLDLGATFPGLTSTTLLLTIGEPPAHGSLVALGRPGAQVQTAQTRLLFVAQALPPPPLLTLRIPVYLEIASATAGLSSLSCKPDPAAPTASLDVRPSLADAWFGAVSTVSLSDFGQAPAVQPAQLASALGVAGIYGRAHVAIGNTTATRVPFSTADIAAHNKHRTTTTDWTASLIESLGRGLQLSLTPTGGGVPTPLLAQAVVQGLGRAAPSVDAALARLLAVLGFELGNADTWITGVRCGGGVLVN